MSRESIILITFGALAFAGVQAALVYAVSRYRVDESGKRAVSSRVNMRVMLLWTAVSIIIFIAVVIMCQRVWIEWSGRQVRREAQSRAA